MVDLSNLSKDLLSDLPTKLPSPPSIDWSAADLFIPLVPPSVLSTTDWKAFVPQSMPPVDSPEFPVIVAGVSLAMGILALSVARGPDDQSTTTTDTDGVAGKRRAKPAKSAFNVEIPYDAATRLAYDEWRREHNSAPYSEEGYSVFRKMYTAQAIADATTKKLTRDMESLFDNRAQPPVPPRQVSQNSASSTSRTNSDQANLPFFASIE